MRKYSKTHEWVEFDGSTAIVGLTKQASQHIGEIVFVDLPTIGTKIKQGQEAAIVESTKAAIDITTPISGVVTKQNNRLKEKPELAFADPEGEGWLFHLKEINQNEFDALLDKKSYEQMTR